MELWYTEEHSENVRFSIKVEEQLYSAQSPFQRIDVFQSKEFGRFFTLDGLMMVTEKDEFIYHDMITHVAMATNPNIKKVLVIGAGDGGTVRELTRYSTIEHIDMVEIDKMVVDVCIKYLPQTACKLNDERVSLIFEDGLKFVRTKVQEYDHKRIKEFFPVCRVYQAHIPTYPSGHWLFGFASKKYDPVKDLDADKWNKLGLKTKYYNTDIHTGAFALPNYVIDLLKASHE